MSELVNVPFALLLLKMLWDAVYQKIPDGFASIKQVADEAHSNAEERHDEHMRMQRKVRKELKKLRRDEPKKKTPRVRPSPDDNGKHTQR